MKDSSTYTIGSDIGTSSCKTVLLDSKAHVVASSSHGYQSYHPNPGWVEQDPEEWYEAFCLTVSRVLESSAVPPGKIAAVCIVGVTHNPVLLDDEGNLLRPAIHFWDRRSVEQATQIKERWGKQVRARALNEVDSLWTWPQLLWIRQNEPNIWRSIAVLAFPKDYARHRLIHGRSTQKIQPTMISDSIDPVGTLLYDPRSSTWIEEFVADLGFPVSALPAIQPVMSIAGQVGSAGAGDTGLLAGTPVLTGTTDTAAEVLGTGALKRGHAILKLASVGRIMLVVDRPLDDPHSLNYPHVFDGLWYPGSVTKHGAGAYSWARQALWPDLTDDEPYRFMDSAAAEIAPGSDGIVFHPHLSGEYAPQWDPELHASFTGLTIQHSRAHMTRAVLEGVAFQMRSALEQIMAAGGRYSEIRLIGGGASGHLWSQIMADVLGNVLFVPAERSAAYGAALLAGMATGQLPKEPAALDKFISIDRICQPDPTRQNNYQRIYEIYQEAEPLLATIFNKSNNNAIPSNQSRL